jgi:hypothetical protein
MCLPVARRSASAFITTESGMRSSVAGSAVLNAALSTRATLAQGQSQLAPLAVGGGGTADYIPIWTNSTTLGNSTLFETGGTLNVIGPNGTSEMHPRLSRLREAQGFTAVL